MAAGPINRMVGQLRRAALGAAERGDAQLLDSFLARREPAAFALLVERHGPMVHGVCRRVLGNEADAEDAFQATFLVLVKKAASIVPREQVGNWLYGVAYRTALKARAMNGKRRRHERQAGQRPRPDAMPADRWPELQAILDEELDRLPAKYRTPVVLCDLEGKTQREAARLLGWPAGTLMTRLRAARRQLAARLTRRGVTLSAGALAALLADHATAAVPATLIHLTLRTAAGTVPATVAALTQGVLQAMLFAKLKTALAVVLGLVLLGGLAGGWGYRSEAQGQGDARNEPRPPPVGPDPVKPDPPPPRTTGPAPVQDAAPETSRGRVTRVDANGLLQISLGHEDGVHVNQVLEVYRLGPKPLYFGRARVLDAQPHTGVAKMIDRPAGGLPAVGDHVATGLLPRTGPTDKASTAPGQQPPPATAVLGKVTHIDRTNHLVEISIGSDDGIKEGQKLDVYRVQPQPAPMFRFVATVKVVLTLDARSIARPVPADSIGKINAGDLACTDVPEGAKQAFSGRVVIDRSVSLRGSPRQSAERFLASAVAGKLEEARALAQPTLAKDRVAALKGRVKQLPPVALVQVEADEALAITAPGDETPLPQRFVLRLRRANPEQVQSGWFASDWLVAEVQAGDAEMALRELIAFLQRQPQSRP